MPKVRVFSEPSIMFLSDVSVYASASAASQAITTYLRSHARRCESEQDAPLLLKHTLSGSPADDDLAPAESASLPSTIADGRGDMYESLCASI